MSKFVFFMVSLAIASSSYAFSREEYVEIKEMENGTCTYVAKVKSATQLPNPVNVLFKFQGRHESPLDPVPFTSEGVVVTAQAVRASVYDIMATFTHKARSTSQDSSSCPLEVEMLVIENK